MRTLVASSFPIVLALLWTLVIAIALVTCAHAGTTEKELAALDPLSVPGDIRPGMPVSAVIHLSIVSRPFDADFVTIVEIDALWDRVAKAELRVLCLEEMLGLLTDRVDKISEDGATQ